MKIRNPFSPVSRLMRIGRKLNVYEAKETLTPRDLTAVRRLVGEADKLTNEIIRELEEI